MNKLNKILLSIIAGIDTTIYLFTPIIISTLWINIFGLDNFGSYLIVGLGFFSTMFRAIKIGWLK